MKNEEGVEQFWTHWNPQNHLLEAEDGVSSHSDEEPGDEVLERQLDPS